MEQFIQTAIQSWPYFALTADLVLAGVASSHALLNKRDVRATIGWVGIIWLAPLAGTILYVMFGINRIKRRAVSLRANQVQPDLPTCPDNADAVDGDVADARCAHLIPLVRLVERVTGRPLLDGNSVTPFINGDAAYPKMLSAINEARFSITLGTYIFDIDSAGWQFVDGLSKAVQRGVEVRVLIDDVGSRYSWPSAVKGLKQAGVNVEKFLPTFSPMHFHYSNLRNHRKILVVDGRIGFTGGMNIREGNNVLSPSVHHPVQDVQFRIQGPVVAQLQEAFAADWAFTTGEALDDEPWFMAAESDGEILARGIPDGPDEDLHTIQNTLLGAISVARTSISVITPYFLPDTTLISALNTAALRGVDVRILIPVKSNLRLVQWASTAQLWQVLESGCEVCLTRLPFDHTKIVIVDDTWSLIGSANWDSRSLRLNFEFNVEFYSRELAEELNIIFENKKSTAHDLTLTDVNSRSLPIRLRDSVARLAAPFL